MEAGEIHTDTMIKNAFEDDKLVFLPRTCGSSMRMLQVKSLAEIENLVPVGKYKLLEPSETAPDAIEAFGGLDMIIVPGLAFSSDGQRLGRGAGYYDKYLTGHFDLSVQQGALKPYTVAVGLQEQLLDNIPCEDHDVPLDRVIINGSIYGPGL